MSKVLKSANCFVILVIIHVIIIIIPVVMNPTLVTWDRLEPSHATLHRRVMFNKKTHTLSWYWREFHSKRTTAATPGDGKRRHRPVELLKTMSWHFKLQSWISHCEVEKLHLELTFNFSLKGLMRRTLWGETFLGFLNTVWLLTWLTKCQNRKYDVSLIPGWV